VIFFCHFPLFLPSMFYQPACDFFSTLGYRFLLLRLCLHPLFPQPYLLLPVTPLPQRSCPFLFLSVYPNSLYCRAFFLHHPLPVPAHPIPFFNKTILVKFYHLGRFCILCYLTVPQPNFFAIKYLYRRLQLPNSSMTGSCCLSFRVL
jgi:hypothetical protein